MLGAHPHTFIVRVRAAWGLRTSGFQEGHTWDRFQGLKCLRLVLSEAEPEGWGHVSACRSGAASRLCPLSAAPPRPAQKAPQSLQSQVHCPGGRVSWSSPGSSPGLPQLCRLARAPHPAGPRPLTCSQLQTFFRGQRGAQKMGDSECPGPSGAARAAVPSQRRLQLQSPGSLLPCNAEVGGALCSPRGGAVVFTGPVDQQGGVVKKVQRTEWTLAEVSSAAQRPIFCRAPRRAFRSQEPGVV